MRKVPGLSEEELEELKKFADQRYMDAISNGISPSSIEMLDMKINLNKGEITSIIGPLALRELGKLFAGNQGHTYDEILIRRCQATGKFINFHTDHSKRTMQVSINSDRDYEGGQLMYLANGQIHIPSRSEPGTISIHENDIVHGVTELVSGVRYGLFFLKKNHN